jgi:hypothetical protein
MNSERRNILQLIIGCAYRSKATISGLLGKIKNNWKDVAGVALLIVLFAFPVSAESTDPLVTSIGDLWDSNKSRVIPLVWVILGLPFTFKFFKVGTLTEAEKELMLMVFLGLVVGTWATWNWKIILNFGIKFVSSVPTL